MKNTSILLVSLLLAATSAFAWSKKSENTGNLGRMYLAIEGGVNKTNATIKNPTIPTYNPSTDAESKPTGADASFIISAPIFKPGVNAFKNIKWAGVDGQVFFNYNYSGDFTANYTQGSTAFETKLTNTNYTVGAALVPYLNFETKLPFLKAVKPFAMGYVGYQWFESSASSNVTAIDGMNDRTSAFVYGVGAGVEFVIIDELSLTPNWKWSCSSQSGMPCVQSVGVDVSYWFTDQFGVSVYWQHNFGGEYSFKYGDSPYTIDASRGDIIGAKFKLGFLR